MTATRAKPISGPAHYPTIWVCSNHHVTCYPAKLCPRCSTKTRKRKNPAYAK